MCGLREDLRECLAIFGAKFLNRKGREEQPLRPQSPTRTLKLPHDSIRCGLDAYWLCP
jgi:hypothetical protein